MRWLACLLLVACASHIHRPNGAEVDSVWIHGKVETCVCSEPVQTCTTVEAGPLDRKGIAAIGTALAGIVGAIAMIVV